MSDNSREKAWSGVKSTRQAVRANVLGKSTANVGIKTGNKTEAKTGIAVQGKRSGFIFKWTRGLLENGIHDGFTGVGDW